MMQPVLFLVHRHAKSTLARPDHAGMPPFLLLVGVARASKCVPVLQSLLLLVLCPVSHCAARTELTH